MAKIWQISDGRSYVVNGDPGTTITYTNSTSNGTAAGKQAASIPAGATSVTFPSNGSEVEISQDTATIDQVFNAAAAGSGSSSGGSGSAGGVTFQIVTTLPSQGAAGVIYLVKVSETGDDRYEEWIWVDSAWESIGTTAVDPTTYAKLIGGNTFEGNQVINGDLTVTGNVSGVTESNYNVVETTETTITPTGGTWVRYTGTETSLTVVEPGWDGEAEISYLETATPVDLQGVTWSPSKPILTGNGPFVYTLVHAGPGQMLAGAYGYSTPTAEAIQAVAPIAWSAFDKAPTAIGVDAVAIGDSAAASERSVVVGANSSAAQYSTVVGEGAVASGNRSICLGRATIAKKDVGIAIGTFFADTAGAYTCTTEGTGSITIGAGANTKNTTMTVDGVETTVESSNAITIGCKAFNTGADSVVIGAKAKGAADGNIAVGTTSETKGRLNVAIGNQTHCDGYYDSVAIGSRAFTTQQHSVAVGAASATQAGNAVALGAFSRAPSNKSIALGYNATITNTTNADNTVTPSDNTIVIGSAATASAPNAVVMGAGASTAGADSIVMGAGASGGHSDVIIGAGAKMQYGSQGVAIGKGATIYSNAVALGSSAQAKANNSLALGFSCSVTGVRSIAIGNGAQANAQHSTAIGVYATAADLGATVIRSTAEDGTHTQLYFSGANTPLANTYANGEGIMGYVTSDKDGNPIASGFKRLSALFDEGTMTQPATLDEFGEWTMPKVFHPSDLDLPVEEEPTEEPEDVTTNIPEPTLPEPEPYTPLPVYPIVEPEVPEIVEEPTE